MCWSILDFSSIFQSYLPINVSKINVGGDKMLLDVASGGFALSLALTNRTDLVSEDMNPEERREALEKIRSRQLEQEVGILVNQIGKMNQPPG